MRSEGRSRHGSETGDIERLLEEAGWVRALAARLARDHASADDAAQATLALALERGPAPAASLRPWLGRVLGRLARRERRGAARRALREAQAARDRDGTAPSSDTQLARLEEQERLARAVRALAEPYRGVLLARFYEGLDANAIAARTGTSAATVRSQLARGLAQLRERLVREHGGDRGRALGLFALAAGREYAATSILPELLMMQTTTKVAIGAAAVLLTAIATWPWVRTGGVRPERELSGAVPPIASSEGGEPAPVVEAGAPAGSTIPVRSAASAPTGEPPTPSPPNAARRSAPQTIVLAVALDERETPLAGATLASVRDDGRPRSTAPSAPSEADGGLRLELADGDLSLYRTTVFPMVFAVRAPNRATRFVVSTPDLHAETDLGRIALPPGGGMRGRVVGLGGHPVEGALLYGGSSEVTGEPLESQLLGPDLDIARPTTTSAADGTFVLDGLEVGPTRLWAHAPRHLWHLGSVGEVRAGAVIDVGDLVLEPVPADRAVAGTVVSPDGAPVPLAHVVFGDPEGSYESRVTADARGTFLVVPERRARRRQETVTLVAVDSARRYGASAARAVAVGTTDARLELRQMRALEVTVTTGEGEPLEGALVAPLLLVARPGEPREHRLPAGEDWVPTDGDGRATLCVPDAEFVVSVSAAGHRVHRTAPIAPERAPTRLAVQLELEPTLRGVVLHEGRPVAGAKLSVGQRHDGFVPLEAGFPLRLFIDARDVAVSDAEGRFAIPIDDAHLEVSVLARSSEHATGEVMVTLERGRGADGVVVELAAGGAVEGSLLPPPGVDPRSLVVAASRGDGFPVWTRPDAEGRYRFERLTPGPWRVEGRDREPARELIGAANRPDEKDFRWNVAVRDGAAARFDVDMRDQGSAALHGRLSIDGAPARGWRVTLEQRELALGRTEMPAATLDDAGRFVLSAPAGRYDLIFSGTWGEGAARADVTVLRELELRGPRVDWETTLTTGILRGSVAAGTARLRLVRGHFRDGDREITEFVPGAGGAYEVRVPAGRASLQHEAEGRYGFGWLTLEVVEAR